MNTQDSQSDGYGLRFESFDDIENELERTFKGYAMANPASFFDRTDAQFKIVATAFIERLRAADRRENEAYVTTRVKEAEAEEVEMAADFAEDVLQQFGYNGKSGGLSTLEWAEGIIKRHKKLQALTTTTNGKEE